MSCKSCCYSFNTEEDKVGQRLNNLTQGHLLMTAESKVKARQGVSRCSGRKWGFSYLEEGDASGKFWSRGDPYAVTVWCILCIMIVSCQYTLCLIIKAQQVPRKYFQMEMELNECSVLGLNFPD